LEFDEIRQARCATHDAQHATRRAARRTRDIAGAAHGADTANESVKQAIEPQ
jgi:hypothetical protein